MKRTLALFLSLSVAFGLTACAGQSSNSSDIASEPASAVSSKQEAEESVPDENIEGEEESKVESEEKSKAESKEESKAESKEESKAESKEESKAESKKESKAESKAESKSDDSVYKDYYTYENVTIKIPDGFEMGDELNSMVIFYCENYPEETDNIAFSTSKESVDMYTEDNVNWTLSLALSDFDGCRDYSKYTIDGFDVVKYSYDITVSDVDITQTQVICFLNTKTVLMAFTCVSGVYDNAFEEAIGSIRILDDF